MVHTYQISGMTCQGCEANVKNALLMVGEINSVEVSKEENTATITMEKHVSLEELQKALGTKYQISAIHHSENWEQTKSWFETYKPVLLIFMYITGVTLLVQTGNNRFDLMQWMRHFMAGFFLIFSLFKMVNLKDFVDSYVTYDFVAGKLRAWAYVYAFIELGLGIAFLINFNPFVTNLITAIVMSLSIIGVLQSVLNKKKIQCACLGAVFNLPMSTVTIIEDALMIVMSVVMIFMT